MNTQSHVYTHLIHSLRQDVVDLVWHVIIIFVAPCGPSPTHDKVKGFIVVGGATHGAAVVIAGAFSDLGMALQRGGSFVNEFT
jgi:hypothetical protein